MFYIFSFKGYFFFQGKAKDKCFLILISFCHYALDYTHSPHSQLLLVPNLRVKPCLPKDLVTSGNWSSSKIITKTCGKVQRPLDPNSPNICLQDTYPELCQLMNLPVNKSESTFSGNQLALQVVILVPMSRSFLVTQPFSAC